MKNEKRIKDTDFDIPRQCDQSKADFDFDLRLLDRDSLQESDQEARRRRHECEHCTYRAEFSLANCDFSVWNGVPNVMTEQVGDGRRWECLSRVLSLSAAVRPPNNSTSQLIARCFIASVSVRIVAKISPCIARLPFSHAIIGTFSLVQLRQGLPGSEGNWNRLLLSAVTDIRSAYRRLLYDSPEPLSLNNLMPLRPRKHSYLWQLAGRLKSS